MCKVTVIMPSLNVKNYIDECLKSVCEQTLKDIEIICIDAGSNDGTIDIIKKYAESDKRVRYINSKKRSYGYQVNRGIEEAQGDYIAIVETDDYIEKNMYEILCKTADKTGSDYVKADFDYFVEDEGGKRKYTRVKLLEKRPELYNRIICPGDHPFIVSMDYNIWKGIYRKSFLEENNIRLNESDGAAYQDIGFAHQVLNLARKAYYTDESLYRYRRSRNESSIRSLKRLQYSYQEFYRLMSEPELWEKTKCRKGFFTHMATSFIGEYEGLLRDVDYDADSEYIKPYYTWFKEHLNELLSDDSFWDEESVVLKKRLRYVLQDEYPVLAGESDKIKSQARQLFIDQIKDNDVVVFGAGLWGDLVLEILEGYHIKIRAVTDNNKELWGTEKYGYRIISPNQCIADNRDCFYVIANKKYAEEMAEQLFKQDIQNVAIPDLVTMMEGTETYR